MGKIKKLFLILVLTFALVLPAGAIEWKTANQITIAWDAYDGIVQPGDQITYKVYSKKLPDGESVFLNEFSVLSAVVTFTTEGRYHLGVQTVRGVDEDGNGSFNPLTEASLESEINWSNVNGTETPFPFGGRYFVNPGKTQNLRIP